MKILLIGVILLILSSCGHEKNNIPHSIVTIGLAGDTMLGRLVNDAIKKYGYSYPWGDMLAYVHKTDLNLVNLETTLTISTEKVPKVFNFKSDPQNVQSLKEARIDVVSLANNHIKDFGNKGLIETIETLDAAHIAHVGAGKNIQQATKPFIRTINGITIGIIGATDNEPDWLATDSRPGIFYFNVHDIDLLLEHIKRLKKDVDIVIVSLHWGPNMRERPTQEYIDAAHNMIEAGATIIHGHSAHIFQGIELYGQGLILYDTGEFVDDYAVDPLLRNDQSFFFIVNVNKNGVKELQLIPTIIDHMQVNRATGKMAQEIISRMQRLSSELGEIKILNDGTVSAKD